MAERKHPPLNDIAVVDRFRVRAFSLLQNVHYLFQAHHPLGNRPAKFSCHVYDSPRHDYAAYFETDTVATDHMGRVRCCASGSSLEELVHNLDWAHKPSELALLKSLLYSRVCTASGEPLGDLVFARTTAEELQRMQVAMQAGAQALVERTQRELTEAATQAIDAAAAQAALAARFGLQMPVKPDFSRLNGSQG